MLCASSHTHSGHTPQIAIAVLTRVAAHASPRSAVASGDNFRMPDNSGGIRRPTASIAGRCDSFLPNLFRQRSENVNFVFRRHSHEFRHIRRCEIVKGYTQLQNETLEPGGSA